ncbi:MAG: TlpA family protein disulfide reductase [Acidimicrobiales bacterium]
MSTGRLIGDNAGAGSLAQSQPTTAQLERAGLRWWLAAFLAVVLGATAGTAIAHAAGPRSSQTNSNQILTSSGGVFSSGNNGPAAPWRLKSLRTPSKDVSLAEFRGHPLVLNFWASWCPPCRQEMPALAHVAQSLRDQVSFVGIDTNDSRSAGVGFLARTGVAYPVAFDPNASAAGDYGVIGLPTTFFIAPSGRILGRQVGAMTEVRLRQLIKRVFKVALPRGGG